MKGIHMKSLFRLALVLMIAALPLSCGKQGGTKTTTIAVIPKGTTHEFWKSIHAGAVKASRELGVEVIWKGPLREDDRDQQISVMENFITRGVSGIVLAPLDDVALRAPVSNAKAAGIPVVIIDSDLKSDDYISFVATDNHLGGVMGGRELARLIGGKGRVIMLRLQEGSASTSFREQGFLDAIREFPNITVVSSNQYAGSTVETAYRASENLLGPFKSGPGKLNIDAIFTPNESTTFGMLRALQDGGFAGNVIFVGFDSSTKLVEAMHDKQIHALVLQNPFRMGYDGVTTVVKHIRGEKVERKQDTGVTLVTPENMDKPDIKQLISPDLTQWLQ
jgi:ribose transport system substrate-binding protein